LKRGKNPRKENIDLVKRVKILRYTQGTLEENKASNAYCQTKGDPPLKSNKQLSYHLRLKGKIFV
jgi:hypothetical protein